ncbi:MAG TPA: Sec-independent protein translocase subunit TatA [Trebonia sp.]|jgi:sec-independent protein translocase protein TatA|nr:Sec-independent protein translocase subunit TatA [Trebonia sp.]
MIGDLFDSPWKILIVAVVIIVLFGSRKLPDAARSLGRSMRILKTEVQGMHDDDPATAAATAQTATAAPAQLQQTAATPDAQAQIAALQEQLNSLQQSPVGAGEAASAQAKPSV